MNINEVVQQNVNYEVFVDGTRYLGTASIDLSEVNYITEEITGAGVAGKIDVPTISHIENIELTLHWRSIFERPMRLLAQNAYILDLRAAIQHYDAANGTMRPVPVRIACRGLVTGTTLGTLEPASNTETESKFNLDYIEITVDGQRLFLHDKFNFRHEVAGKDFMAQVRSALGI